MQWAFYTQSLENTIKTIYDHSENTLGQCQGKGCTSNAAVGRVPGHQDQPRELSTARALLAVLQALGKPAAVETRWWNLAGVLKEIQNASYILLQDSLVCSLQYFLLFFIWKKHFWSSPSACHGTVFVEVGKSLNQSMNPKFSQVYEISPSSTT